MTSTKHSIKNDLAVIFAYAQLIAKKNTPSEKELKTIEDRVKDIEKKLEML
jgi:two-component sensor histidine kinase